MFTSVFSSAKAHIKGGREFPRIDGIVTFKEVKNGVILTAKIHNLPGNKTHCNRKILWFSYS